MRGKYGEITFSVLYYSTRTVPAKVIKSSLRTMEATQVENVLNLMGFILSHAKVLMGSANTLSHSLIRAQIPAERLTIEIHGIRLDTHGKCSLQDLDTLLELCGNATPDRSQNGEEVVGSPNSVTLCPSLSHPLSSQHFLSRSRPRTPTTIVSCLISPAKHGAPTVCSTLTSPAKLPIPYFFNDALRAPSIASSSC